MSQTIGPKSTKFVPAPAGITEDGMIVAGEGVSLSPYVTLPIVMDMPAGISEGSMWLQQTDEGVKLFIFLNGSIKTVQLA